MPLDPSWRDPGTLLQIDQAARKAAEYVRGKDRQSFCADELTNNAVILQLTILGEATKRLSDSTRKAYPHIPWAEMAGLRDRLVHGYDRWDLERVWDIVSIDIPKLIDDLEPIVPKEERGG
jgi:uncharacterized protein with HEPN domain